jgi:predicted transcriptional regulator
MHQSTNTSKYLVVSSDSSSASSESPIQVDNNIPVRRKSNNKKNIENAIYAHVRAIRALGRKKINTTEIAEALSLPIFVVNQAITSLLKKGVKVVNG